MKYSSLRSFAPGSKTFVAVAIAMACSAASALPQFTFNTTSVGGSGSVTADNILLSDFSTVTLGAGSSFSETGYLSFTGYQLGGTTLAADAGLNSSYSLYVMFSGAGTLSGSIPVTGGSISAGSFSSLTYSLYAVNSTTSFTPTSVSFGSNPAATATLLGTGSLGTGNGTVTSGTTGSAVTSAGATVSNTSFLANSGSFFAAPVPFYDLAFATFSNTSTQIVSSGTGFSIVNGGGALNFAVSPVPEPSTYALMLAGLAVVGGVARRRKNRA
ncbi:MAG: hypothetical protein JWQ11_4478 [Rhizobacter sp.]|nr:hypothetical protein [Rhizobacter sp.]